MRDGTDDDMVIHESTEINKLEDIDKRFPVVYDMLLFVHQKWLKNDDYTFNLWEEIDHVGITNDTCKVLEDFLKENCETRGLLIDFLKGRNGFTEKKNYPEAKTTLDTLFYLQKEW